ncbi:MAG: HEAT repeat domain-containing protein [Kofleriaceae bacterium]
MLGRLALVLATLALAAPARAERFGFAWAGRIENDGAPLVQADPDDDARRAAINAMRAYDPVLARRFVLVALDDEDEQVRLTAARIAARGRITQAVPQLTAWLASPDRALRRVAAESLGVIAEPTSLAFLVRALGDVEPEVRLAAVVALGKLGAAGDRSVVVPLLSRVADDKSEVRQAALEALRGIGDRRAVVAVVTAFTDPNLEVRKAAVVTAGRLGDPAAIPALTRLLDEPQVELRNLAIGALGALGAGEAVTPLIGFLQRGGDGAAPAAFALGEIAAAATSDDVRAAAVGALVGGLVDPGARTYLVEGLRRAGAAAVPGLVDCVAGRRPGDPATAVALLGEQGDARATPVLIAELDRRRLPIAGVVAALAKTGDPRALVPVLALASNGDPAIRRVAMVAVEPLLGQDRRAADVLVERLGDPEEDLQILACRYLAQLGARSAAPAIAALAGAPRGPGLRRAAIEALGVLGDPATSPVLLAGLADPDPVLARAAADALTYLGDPSLAARLGELAGHPGPTQAYVVRAWGAALRDRPDRRARATLLELASTGPTPVALAAIAAIAASGDPAAAPGLVELLTDATPDRQAAAAAALGELALDTAPPAVAKALVLALGSRDDRIAGAAARAAARLPIDGGDEALRGVAARGGWAARTNAIAALATRGGDAAVADLTTSLGHRDALARGNAAWALGRRAASAALPDATIAALVATARDPSPWVRAHAARALRARPTPAATAALAQLASDDPDPGVRAAAVAAPVAAPPADQWRIFDVVEPEDDRPVRGEPYLVLLGAQGPAWATYTDLRGVIWAEHLPAEVAAPRPAAAAAEL